jgi:hypothetical protein
MATERRSCSASQDLRSAMFTKLANTRSSVQLDDPPDRWPT